MKKEDWRKRRNAEDDEDGRTIIYIYLNCSLTSAIKIQWICVYGGLQLFPEAQ